MTDERDALPRCACGCGKEVSKLSNTYILGHHVKFTGKPFVKGIEVHMNDKEPGSQQVG